MPTLDLLSQVLFVALMAMFLYVLYRRFVAMMMKGRITGAYSRVISCHRAEDGRVHIALDAAEAQSCSIRWEGGVAVDLDLKPGEQTIEVDLQGAEVQQVHIDFGNQQVARRIEG